MRNALAALLLVAAASIAAVAVPARAGEAEVMRTTSTQTVWVRVKDVAELADKINKTHIDMSSKGFRLVDTAPYVENGDTVGMFLTYVRE